MKASLLLLATTLSLASCSDGQSFSRDGASDETNVDSSSTTSSSPADVGDQSRNVDFRSSTSSLPDSQHPGVPRNAEGQPLTDGNRDGATTDR